MKTTNQGKRPDQYEKDAQIFVVGVLFVFAVIALIFIGKSCEAQSKYQIGFLTTFQDLEVKGIEEIHLFEYSQIDSVVAEKMNIMISSRQLMDDTGLLIIENGTKKLYCEMKFVKPNGKLKKFRRLRSEDIIQYSLINDRTGSAEVCRINQN